MKIVVVGSINMDYVLKVNELPKLGETLTATYFDCVYGGKGANQAVAAARLGAEVTMVGAVGNDSIGEDLKKNLQNEKINTDGINIADNASGIAMITVDNKGDNTIVVYPGANFKLDENWIDEHDELIRNADCLLVQLEIPMNVVMKAVKLANMNGVKVIFNPAPAKEVPKELYKYVDIITPNETELQKLTDKEDIKEGAKVLLDRGAKSVVVTLGEKGSLYIDNDREYHAGTFKVDSIDSTAAGDAFNAALAIKVCEGEHLKTCLRYANAVGALVTTKLGAQASLPHKDEVVEMLKL